MGASKSKESEVAVSSPVTSRRPADLSRRTLEEAPPAADFSKSEPTSVDSFQAYTKFRDELFSFAVGESAFDFAERLFREQPSNPQIMALLAETVVMYDVTKNKGQKEHWVDRMDLLQRGIDVSRKCIKDNPEYGPCYRSYVLSAIRAAEANYYYRWMDGVGLVENYHAIMKRGLKAIELNPGDPDIPNALGSLNGRCVYKWYSPYNYFSFKYRLPSKRDLLDNCVKYHNMATERDPGSAEHMCRLGQAYFFAGDFPRARKCFMKVRDEISPRSTKDDKWQAIAHTELSTAFAKMKWNVPFG